MIKSIISKIKNKKRSKNSLEDINRNLNYDVSYRYVENLDILKIKNIDFKNVDSKNFVDMPDSSPRVKLDIPKVGVTQRPHYIKIVDPFKDSVVNINTFIKIFMPLNANKRGLHMSRIERILYSAQQKQYSSLPEYTEEIIKPLIEEQNATRGEIHLKCLYEKETDKNQSGRKGHEILYLYSKTTIKDNKLKTFVGLGVYFMNACPCPQRWAIRNFYYKLKEKGYQDDQIYEIIKDVPLESHTNRGIVNLFVEDKKISYKTLYQILDSSVTIVRELLSGKDEHLFIREAHEKELFCEDVVREVAFNVVKYLNKEIDDDKKIVINTEVDESIHFHNLYAEISSTFGELKNSFHKYENL
jgi:MptA/FolE2 family GTP cyclohydrolase